MNRWRFAAGLIGGSVGAVLASRKRSLADTTIGPPNPSLHPEDAIAVEELQRLNEGAQYQAKLLMVEDGVSASYPDDSIVVGRSEIRRFMAAGEATQMRSVIRFLLAHEIVHLTQFRGYRYDPKSADLQTVRAMESEADLLGGVMLYLSLNPAATEMSQSILDSLRVLFAIGDPETQVGPDGQARHPSHEARRTSLRHGLAAGFFVVSTIAAKAPDPRLRALAQGNVDHSSSVLEINASADQQWSLRHARKITHWRSPVGVNVVGHNVGISADGIRFDYDLTYQNVGSAATYMDASVQSVSFNRAAPGDTYSALLMGTRQHEISLPPGATTTISGSLERFQNGMYEAQLVFPPNPLSLYCGR